MADDTEDQAPAPAHGPAAAGKGKKGGLLNGPHREMIIVVCSVVGVGLALMTFRGKGSGSSTAAAGSTTALGSPASAVLSGGQVAGFDQNAVYGLQTMLANQAGLLQNLEASLTTAPATPTAQAPLAASLLHPSYNGNYVRFQDGAVDEVESDGSLYWLTASEHQQAFGDGGYSGHVDQLTVNSPTSGVYSTGGNLLARQPGATPATVTANV